MLLLDASGKDVVFVETVGAGQSEVEVIGIADTVLLVLMPGSGDSVQALKAGIMEIPDVIAINKMDHPAAKTMLQRGALDRRARRSRERRPAILLTEALRGEDVPELWDGARGAPRGARRATASSRSAAGGTSRPRSFAVASSRAKRICRLRWRTIRELQRAARRACSGASSIP